MLRITPAELAALQLLANDTPAPDIARRLGVSETDLEAHLTTLFARMGAASRTDAVAAAFRRGLLPLDNQIGNGH